MARWRRRSSSFRHCLIASGEVVAAGGLRSSSLAAASGPPLAAREGALDAPPTDACCRVAGTAASGALWREACDADDAIPSRINTSSSRGVMLDYLNHDAEQEIKAKP